MMSFSSQRTLTCKEPWSHHSSTSQVSNGMLPPAADAAACFAGSSLLVCTGESSCRISSFANSSAPSAAAPANADSKQACLESHPAAGGKANCSADAGQVLVQLSTCHLEAHVLAGLHRALSLIGSNLQEPPVLSSQEHQPQFVTRILGCKGMLLAGHAWVKEEGRGDAPVYATVLGIAFGGRRGGGGGRTCRTMTGMVSNL